jgi:prepilin-type N-terminal cleavage/methylation domain-containing protein
MNNLNQNNKGFGVVELLMAVVIVALVATVGYMAYKNHQKPVVTPTTASTNKTTPKTATAQTATSYFTIKEWGIRSPYSGSLTLSYVIKDNKYAYFSSKQLTAADANCVGRGGAFSRYLPNDSINDGGSTETAAQSAAAFPALYKLINGYYYSFSHDQAACSDNQSATDLQSQTNDAAKALISGLVAVPNP